MDEQRITERPSWNDPRGQVMKTPDDVAAMVRLKACGWGIKRIAAELGCSHHTVKHYVKPGGPITLDIGETSSVEDCNVACQVLRVDSRPCFCPRANRAKFTLGSENKRHRCP